MGCWTRAVRFAESVTAGDQRDRFFIVHRHAGESLADISCGSDRIGISVRPFWINVNQSHLHRREGLLKLSVAGVSFIIQPSRFLTPIDILIWLPDILASAAKAEGFKAHCF